jgi:hypothetical protein
MSKRAGYASRMAPLSPITIKLGTEAALSVLSVDSIILSKTAGGPKVPQQVSDWDKDDFKLVWQVQV